jgi:hypothetical protein
MFADGLEGGAATVPAAGITGRDAVGMAILAGAGGTISVLRGGSTVFGGSAFAIARGGRAGSRSGGLKSGSRLRDAGTSRHNSTVAMGKVILRCQLMPRVNTVKKRT